MRLRHGPASRFSCLAADSGRHEAANNAGVLRVKKMSKPIEVIYIASCPFCDYRELFPSERSMARVYEAHLCTHEAEVLARRRSGHETAHGCLHNIAEHVERLEAAQYN
jgi:hypothetical protein